MRSSSGLAGRLLELALQAKFRRPEELDEIARSAPRPMVFTNGVFDLLHPGHVSYLEEARALGASLFVGLNSDMSTRLLEKGKDRPINPERDRAIMLAALESVSFVAAFDEPTPLTLIRQVRPDIYVKGGDYAVEKLEEAAYVIARGGRAQALQFTSGYSTTDLLRRIRSAS